MCINVNTEDSQVTIITSIISEIITVSGKLIKQKLHCIEKAIL